MEKITTLQKKNVPFRRNFTEVLPKKQNSMKAASFSVKHPPLRISDFPFRETCIKVHRTAINAMSKSMHRTWLWLPRGFKDVVIHSE